MTENNVVENVETNVPQHKLTNKELNSCFWRFVFFPMCTINYERFQTLQYFQAMKKVIQKLYPSKEDQIDAAKRHMAFFNTTPQWMGIPLGISCATEETIANLPKGEERTELENSVNVVKASLMGPLAGIGDSLDATIVAIIGALSAGFAINGSILGAVLMLVLGNAYYLSICYFGYFYSYRNGIKVIRDMNKSNILDKVMEAASILGMTALGALVPSWVGFNLTTNIQIGDYVLNIQQELNNIIPGLAPLVLTLILASLYKKNISSIKLVVLIFIIAFVMALIGLTA